MEDDSSSEEEFHWEFNLQFSQQFLFWTEFSIQHLSEHEVETEDDIWARYRVCSGCVAAPPEGVTV